MQKFTAWLKATYDRLVAVVILSVLIVSLLYLAVRIGVVRAQQAAWEREIVNLAPEHEHAAKVGSDEFTLTMSRLDNPHVIPVATWTRRLVVPEERFSCEDCKYPNPLLAENCASCQKVLNTGKPDADFDGDMDGIPDLKEEEYGLDATDPSDALLDKDGDGFDNLLEFRKQTDPKDHQSKPSIEAWIVLDAIQAEAFNLLFKAYSTLPDGSKTFQLNTRVGGKTIFAKMGDQVEGFSIINFATNFVQQTEPIRMTVDKAELSLKTGEKTIVLVKGQEVKWDEFNAAIVYERTGQKFLVHKEDVFELEGVKYKVLGIDTASQTVVINRISDNKEFRVEAKRAGTIAPPAEDDAEKGDAGSDVEKAEE